MPRWERLGERKSLVVRITGHPLVDESSSYFQRTIGLETF